MRRRAVFAVAVLAAVVALVIGGLVLLGGDDGDDGTQAASTTTETTAPPAQATAGAAGVGDPYFAETGNGGYDVEHYALDLTYTPDGGRLDGVAAIEATAGQRLASFNLDLVGLEVTEVMVDGEPAEVARQGEREVVVTPAGPIEAGAPFLAEVTYGGVPAPLSPRGELLEPGWVDLDGEVHVIAEPDGAATFFPSNDHPSDKATYEYRVTVPEGLDVAANGTLIEQVPAGSGRQTWVYDVADPMASYLVQVVIADLEFVEGTGPNNLPIRHAFDADVSGGEEAMARTAEMIDVFDDMFGPYPFEAYGAVVVDEDLGFALETQTLSIFGTDSYTDPTVVAHELAHQWFGDHVTLGTWRDIWLNEGFATYAQWLWDERSGGPTAEDWAREAAAGGGLDLPPGDPGPDGLFDISVYYRGALTLHVLRHELGDDAFFQLLQTWGERYGGQSATTADFEALAAEVAGRDLRPLFDAWLRAPQAPNLDDFL
jgi:aminopeptidase N